MTKSFTDPQTGNSIRFIKTAQETNGELLEVEVLYTPNSIAPPPHFHPHQEERFEVIEGTITVNLDGEQKVFKAGESFVVPKRTSHAMWNADDTDVRLNWQTRPAMKTQNFFETLWGLQQDGKLNSQNLNLVHIAVIFRAFHDEVRLTRPPEPIQTILFSVMAFIGRMLGYKVRYE